MRVAFLLFTIGLFIQTVSAQFFSENFDQLIPNLGQQIPVGWTAQNLNNDNAFWDVLPNSSNFPNNARSAPNAIHMNFDIDNPANDWLFTPPLSLSKNNRYTVRFWYRNVDTGFGTVEKLKVHLSPQANAAVVQTIPLFVDSTISNMDYQLAEFSFIAANSQDYFLGFHCFSDPFQFLVAFDDLEIEETLVNPIAEVAWANQIQVFPNPASNFIQIQIPEGFTDLQLLLFNEHGTMVLQKNNLATHNQIPLEALGTGIYAYLIRDNQGQSTSGRFTLNK